jgi:hypothetical protein
MRSVLAVVAGYLVFGVGSFALFRLSGHDPHAAASPMFKVFAIALGVFFAAIGGYVAGVIAPKNPLAHGTVLGILIALIAAISFRALPPKAAAWTQVSAFLAMAPAAVLGSAFRKPRSPLR